MKRSCIKFISLFYETSQRRFSREMMHYIFQKSCTLRWPKLMMNMYLYFAYLVCGMGVAENRSIVSGFSKINPAPL